jgi:lipopolysaccharide/colanic/teichoic acid biosynthesis glycosyltransferase
MSARPTQPVEGLAVAVLDRTEPALVGTERAPTLTVASSRPVAAASGKPSALRSSFVRGVRRGLDLFAAAVLLLVASPLLIAIAIAIRIDSKGPVLFRQRRVGRGQREFTTFKFRTMCHDADATRHRKYVQTLIGGNSEAERGRLYKLSVDDRVTRVGRLLRSWSLDELPQLINVLRGEMALVGPRPVIPYEVEMYPEDYLRRFAVKPGLTGLWQVSGRNERTYDEMVSFDIEYAEADSLLLDLRILLRTVPVVLRRQGVA